MLKLVNYEDSSDDEPEDVLPLVSTMAVEGVPFKPTYDSHEIMVEKPQEVECSNEQARQVSIGPANDEILLEKLQEYGCSYEQAAQALCVCGSSATVLDLFEYIQACNCDEVNEGPEPQPLDLQGDQEKKLIDMGYTLRHIINALEACGKQSSTFEVVDFLQAHYCSENSLCSENKVAERDHMGCNDYSCKSPSKRLQAMGCSHEAITKAISVCGEKAHVSDLFDFIQAFQYPFGNEGCTLNTTVKENMPLDEIGVSQRHIPEAFRDCDKSSNLARSESFVHQYCDGDKDEAADIAAVGNMQTNVDELGRKVLEKLSSVITPTEETMGQHKETIATFVGERYVVNAERDLIGPNKEFSGSPFKQLKEMGCSCEDIAKAISACGETTHVSDLFDFIQACCYTIGTEGSLFHFPVLQENVPLNETGFLQGHMANVPVPCSKSRPFDRKEFSEAGHSNKDEDDIADVAGYETKKSTVEDEPPPKVLEDLFAENIPTEETKVAERDLTGLHRKFNASSIGQLEDMGCSSEDIAIAVSVCGDNANVSDLFDFIQASQAFTEDEGIAFDVPAFEERVPQDETGFPDVLRAYGKEDLDILDVIQTHYHNGDKRAHLIGSPLPFATNVAGPSKRMAKRLKRNRNRTKTWFSFSEQNVAGPSKRMAKRLEKNENKTKTWSSFSEQKKNDVRSFDSGEKVHEPSESEERDHDRLASLWEGPEVENMANLNHGRFLQPERMMGFGLPGQPSDRPIPVPHCMQGPPFFYFENVANVIDNSWNTIKLHFNGVEPEFVDSRYFSATRRQRGYVHNLPVQSRKLVLPPPPMTILETFPRAKKYWPHWDTREKMNCITTKGPMLKCSNDIRSTLSNFEGMDVPDEVQQIILRDCRKYNLLWVGPNELASLEVREIEMLLGFDEDHTRGSSSMTDRYEMLGNSFQIHTVAYHMSPLQSSFQKGITMLSLFTGIGGAEVALDKLGIFLKRVVVVEKNEKTRDVFYSWWKRSGQRGELICKYHDVKELTYEVLTELLFEVGKIDLVIGGSPCNNLTGSNRWSRNGLNGTESSLFFEFPRILNCVKKIMEQRGYS